ncbi:Protein ecdysoneless-like [Colletotrichum gloeosporioides]|uniref:Protein ecdysoneless-like n=1 Tax=Colletotrichum gloeosporioides TaxID=474922 RepID=A0A8H4C5Y7_COLGL|nr:Protein ecdysoneless-like [Colletotrichum gloeosporioides]KAF3797872.1 Protein ecdysoneless-like [Colletotrichum gloeosporioides]
MAAHAQDELLGLGATQYRLSENHVEYCIFLIDSEAQGDSREQLSRLEKLRKTALLLGTNLAGDYIWQRDSLNLEVTTEQGLAFLRGVSDYGDSVEDEWLMVYILRELSKSDSAVWIRISDSDGEFLLVEAANVLPKWLSPENDQHRVWINNGRLCIIPLGQSSPVSDSQPLTLAEAVKTIRKDSKDLMHSEFIEAEAFYRLEKYPGQIWKSVHHSLVRIPRRLAHVLHQTPRAVAPAVESFYLRDALDLRALMSKAENLRFPPHDMVTLSVKLTKVLFAQLRSQRFEPPAPWSDVVEKAQGNELSCVEMGMKLTSGFEIMMNNINTTKSREAREASIVVADLEEDGESVLPTDYDIQNWKDSQREDDESWLDVNYEDFEKELQGRRESGKGRTGFGDPSTQADLRKIVSRFEAFLNDERAGLEGAETEDMDIDDDDDNSNIDDDSEDGSDEEDKAVSFDEAEFSRMMREMMGLAPNNQGKASPPGGTRKSREGFPEDPSDEDLRELAAQLEAELTEHGALRLEVSDNSKAPAVKGKDSHPVNANGLDTAVKHNGSDDEDNKEAGDEAIDIDYNLAKNLLESFKGQAGLPGPAGNILGMMGMQLPRDEVDGDTKGKK